MSRRIESQLTPHLLQRLWLEQTMQGLIRLLVCPLPAVITLCRRCAQMLQDTAAPTDDVGSSFHRKLTQFTLRKPLWPSVKDSCTVLTPRSSPHSDCQRIISGVYGRKLRQLSLVLTSKKELHTHITVCWVFPCLTRPLITEVWFRSPANAC